MKEIRPRAAVLATIGSIAVAASAYFDWLGNRSPVDTPVQRLLLQPDAGDAASSYWMSMAASLVVAGAIGTVGTLLLSRLVIWLGLLLGAATVGLWAATALSETSPNELVADLQPGAWISVGAIVLMLLGAVALRRRKDDLDEDEDDLGGDFETTPMATSRQPVADDGP